jgi:hypothetical protein
VSVEAEPYLDDKDYKKTPKLTWISNTEKARPIPFVSIFFDHIISKPVLTKDEDLKQYINTNKRVRNHFFIMIFYLLICQFNGLHFFFLLQTEVLMLGDL